MSQTEIQAATATGAAPSSGPAAPALPQGPAVLSRYEQIFNEMRDKAAKVKEHADLMPVAATIIKLAHDLPATGPNKLAAVQQALTDVVQKMPEGPDKIKCEYFVQHVLPGVAKTIVLYDKLEAEAMSKCRC